MKLFVDPSLPDHPKVAVLSAALGVGVAEAVGYLVKLWCRVLLVAENGDLRGWSDAYIADAAGWHKADPSADGFVAALFDAGFLDGEAERARKAHDWIEWQGNLVAKRVAAAERQRRHRAATSPRIAGNPSGNPVTRDSRVTSVTVTRTRTVPFRSVPTDTSNSNGRSTVDDAAPAAESLFRNGADGATGVRSSESNLPANQETRVEALGGRNAASDAASACLDAVLAIWNAGRESGSHVRRTPKRLAKIRTRLADGFAPDRILAAVRKLKASPFHNGGNDRGWRCPGPEWVLESTERLEQWSAGSAPVPAAARAPRCRVCNDSGEVPSGVVDGRPVMGPCSCTRRRASQ